MYTAKEYIIVMTLSPINYSNANSLQGAIDYLSHAMNSYDGAMSDADWTQLCILHDSLESLRFRS